MRWTPMSGTPGLVIGRCAPCLACASRIKNQRGSSCFTAAASSAAVCPPCAALPASPSITRLRSASVCSRPTHHNPVPVGKENRTFLEDGDTVIFRGWCGRPGAARIGFGEVRGSLLPA